MDREKFISIVKENQRLIYKICYTYCKDSESRKDLEQEILVQIWKSLSRFDGRVKVSTWIYQVALNTAFLFHRNEAKHKKNKIYIDKSVLTVADTNVATELDERIAKLYRFIDTLDKLNKALVILYLEDRKYKEIADILGITETNVGTKIGRIKNKLKDYFQNS
ncbi:MAG: sigma-70 family RNA polymerase sigma factor [Tenuifilaceae bacterium]|nr:sigma-70 family RNA polymerase sigma factor [Tenuifilaceae bacterium]